MRSGGDVLEAVEANVATPDSPPEAMTVTRRSFTTAHHTPGRRQKGLTRDELIYGDHAITRWLVALVCALCVASLATNPVGAAELQLGLPVACSPEDDCSIQNHVDLKEGPGVRDFACGVLTYDGHRGTDFQVRDLARMRAGVPVVAAAAGVVRRSARSWRRMNPLATATQAGSSRTIQSQNVTTSSRTIPKR